MNTWAQYLPLIISILSFLGVGTFFSLIWKDLYRSKQEKLRENSEAQQLKKKLERQTEFREVIKEELKPIKVEITDLKEEVADIKKDTVMTNHGTLAGLRCDILKVYYDCNRKGYKTKNDAENFRDLCEAYEELGGNSFIKHDIIPAFDKLKLSETNIKKTTTKKCLNESK